jgi:uncharacterized membrane protein YkvA (DUF1232 family)
MDWTWLLIALGVLVGIYAGAVAVLLLFGRKDDARALAGFVPDCVVLLSRLLKDQCVSRRRSFVLVALVAYLSSPIDLVPDFLPVIGHLDDAVIVALALRWITRDCAPSQIAAHWPGPQASLGVVLRLAGAERS